MSTHSLTDALAETLALFEESGAPWTTSEVADRLDLGRRSTYDRLERLVEEGYLETKKAGASARVWWRPSRGGDGSGTERADDPEPESDVETETESGAKPSQSAESAAEGRADRTAFESLVDAVEEYAIFRLDAEGRVRTWNEGARRIKGYEAEEIVGEHFSTFYTGADRAAGVPASNLADAAEHGSTEDEGWRVRADGTRFWANVTITAVRDDDGDLEGYVKVTRDMTDRREYEQQLREERNFTRQVLETAPASIFVVDAGGEIVTGNDRFGEQFGTGTAAADLAVYDEAGDPVPADGRPYRTVFETGEPVTDWQCQVELPDGQLRWISFNVAPIVEEDEVERAVVAARDVTQNKEQERRLERQRDELEAELGEIFERIDDGFYAVDDEFRFTYVNERAEELLQHAETELLGRTVWEVFPEATETPAWESFHTALESQEATSYEVYFPPLDFWVEASVYPSESGLSVYFRDITDRKERERELERYETLFEESTDVNAVVDAEGRFQHVTPSVSNVLGYEPGELVGEVAFDYVHPDDVGPVTAAFEPMVDDPGHEPRVEFRFAHGDGSWVTLEALGRNLLEDPDIEGIVVYTRDITERRERERELERYETIVETVNDGVYVMDDDDRFTMVNDAYAELTGYDREELLGEPGSKVVDPETVETAAAIHADLAAGEREAARLEAVLETADGEAVPAEATFSVVETGESDTERVGVVRDVTERKRRERELEQYEQIVEAVEDGIYALDDDGRFILINEALCELTGYDREELLGARAETVYDESHVPEVVEQARAVREDERDVAVMELDLVRRDGTAVPIESRYRPFPYGDGFGRCGVVRDISERLERERELERRIRQQETVAELGHLALEGDDVDELMAEAAERVAAALDADYCKVLDLDAGAGELLLREGVGWTDGIVGEATVSAVAADSQAAYTLASSEPVVVENLATETRFGGPDLLTDHDVRSGVSVVIGSSEDPWGILGVHDTDGRVFGDDQVTFVQSVANVLATAIGRHDDEQALRRQRERLAALDNLNRTIREITDAVIDQSTREEIERTVCEHLAATDSYEFAWTGEADVATEAVNPRAQAGADGYLEGIEITVDPDDERSQGPTGRAFLTGEMQTTQDVAAEDDHDPWRDHVEEYDFRSSAAVPVVHGDTTYGVLNVYAGRPNAFEGREREVVAQLGEIVGHAIAAAERKQALMSDELVELEFGVQDVFGTLDLPTEPQGTVTLDHAVPVASDDFLVYGTATPDAVDTLSALVEVLPHWAEVTVDEDGTEGAVDFEARLTDPPILSAVASLGGYVDSAVIEDGGFRITIHLAPSVEVRRVIDAVEAAYPSAEMLRRQQIDRADDDPRRVQRRFTADLTDRQHAALEAAYHAGFFEWPRDADGTDVADSLGVAPPTFHQHLRKAEKKVFGSLFATRAT